MGLTRHFLLCISIIILWKKKSLFVVYLGDIFNKKGNNTTMIESRVNKATGKIITIFAMVDDATFGAYRVPALVTMYHSVYLPSIIFNCQSWTNITKADTDALAVVQLKYLKRVLKVPQSTPNCFVYLELGILPVIYEIHKCQFTFLHHILTLPADDPVFVMYTLMKELPLEHNWANNIKELKKLYHVSLTDDEISKQNAASFKGVIDKKVTEKAFSDLQSECLTKKKTQTLRYTTFKQQEYLSLMNPSLTPIATRIRTKMLDTKVNRPYLFSNPITMVCRHCGAEDESLYHIINCYIISLVVTHIDAVKIYEKVDVQELESIARLAK